MKGFSSPWAHIDALRAQFTADVECCHEAMISAFGRKGRVVATPEGNWVLTWRVDGEPFRVVERSAKAACAAVAKLAPAKRTMAGAA